MFQNNQIIKTLKFTDLKKICFQQYLDEKIDLTSDQILTTVRVWDPSNWSISKSKEITITKKISCQELNLLILKYFPEINV